MEEIRPIIEKITEYYEVPLRVGSRCEANVYYRLEDLSGEDLETLAAYISERVWKVCAPNRPDLLINMPGGYTGLSQLLAIELAEPESKLEVVNSEQLIAGNGRKARFKGANTILVTDVVTTARSCLEAHTRATMLGATVLCWASIIDRTFGPGPVPVVAAFTGEPVRLLERVP